jgi:drug/metabolite transporter (DMT)-like permease
VFFWFVLRKQTQSLKIFASRPGLLLVAACGLGFNYLGFMQGVNYAGPASAQIFIQTGPLLLALAGIFFFHEKLSKRQKWGLVGCLLGFTLFFGDRVGHPVRTEHFFIGLVWIFSAAFTWAVFASLLKVLLQRWKSNQVNLYIYSVVSLIYIPWVDWSSLQAASLWVHMLFVFLGLNTIIAYGSLSVALHYLPATQVSPILTMNPLFTLVLLAIMEGLQWTIIPAEPIGWVGYLGAIMAIFGIRFVLAKPARPLSRKD